MDPLSHTLLGLCIAKVIASEHVGKWRTFWLVLLSANLADLDYLISALGGAPFVYTSWPGILHTAWALLLVPCLVAWAFSRTRKQQLLVECWQVSVACYASHLALDSLTAVGIAPFATLSPWRSSLGWLAPVDVGVWIILCIPLWLRTRRFTVRRLNASILVGLVIYAGVAAFAHKVALIQSDDLANEDGLATVSIQVYPAGLLPLYWEVVINDGSLNHQYRMNLFSTEPSTPIGALPVNGKHPAVVAFESTDVGQQFRTHWSRSPHSRVYCTAPHKRTVLLGDLRFENALFSDVGVSLLGELNRDKQSLTYTLESFRWLGPFDHFEPPKTNCGLLRTTSVP